MKTLPLLIPAALLPMTLLAACGGKAADDEAAAPAEKPVAQVRLAIARAGRSSDTVTAYGSTEPGPGADQAISVPAEAIVVKVDAPTGTAVEAGQPIVTLRASPATRTAIAKASSDAQLATTALARAQRLRRDGLVSDTDVETARAAATTARATVANLGVGAGGTTLRAPVAGTVQGLAANAGDQLAAGAAVASIVRRGDLRARIGVDPSVARRIRPGMAIQLQSATGGATFTVPVVGVDPQVDAATKLASVFARLPAGAGLSAGQPLRATLHVGAALGGIAIPYAALLDDGGHTYVFVARGGVAHRIDVVPGNSSGDTVEVVRGLNAGDRVVVEGGTALEDGMKVSTKGAGAEK